MLVGAKSITLVEAVQWKAGDKFVLTTTSWKDELKNENEVLTVASVTNNGLTINTVEALQFNHYGAHPFCPGRGPDTFGFPVSPSVPVKK